MDHLGVVTREVQMASLSPLLEEVLQSGGTVELTVTGSSMWPMLLHKVSRVKLASVRTLKKGDIPLYRRENGTFVLHRIAEEENGSYTCCGDNQWYLERGLRKDQIIAVVTGFCRKDRWVLVDDCWYRCYWHIWLAVRPLRRLVFGGCRRVARMYGCIREK